MSGSNSFPNSSFSTLQSYNLLDCCNTLALKRELEPQLCSKRASTYHLSQSLQAPILSMLLRGVNVNKVLLGIEKAELREQADELYRKLNLIVTSLTPGTYNPNSIPQLRSFLFSSLGATPVIQSKKGVKKVATDREALETMMEKDPILSPFIELLLLYRDKTKLLQTLSTGLDPDGRIRTFYSIAGTETGRLSSSENAFGRGGNLQNWTESLRSVLIADPGYIILDVDLAGADSWNVGMEVFSLLGDESYLDAIRSGDLHTYVARMVWPELPWTGDIKQDKRIAKRPFYRHHDYRFMCKKGGHGSNYLGKSYTISRQMKIPLSTAELFQERYFSAFPAIPAWQQKRITELQLNASLTTILNRLRYFHSRLRDASTWREAIAYLGQSPTADIINHVMMNLFISFPEAQLLLQTHDSITLQIPTSRLDLVDPIISSFSFPITLTSPQGKTQTFSIPTEAAVGYNCGKRYKELPDGTLIESNPDGLDTWRGADGETRTRKYNPAASLLDRVLC